MIPPLVGLMVISLSKPRASGDDPTPWKPTRSEKM